MKKINKAEMIREIEQDVYTQYENMLYDFNEEFTTESDLFLDKIWYLEHFKHMLHKYETSMKYLIKNTKMEDDLRQHKMAVYLNTQCGMIYDIALIVSKFL